MATPIALEEVEMVCGGKLRAPWYQFFNPQGAKECDRFELSAQLEDGGGVSIIASREGKAMCKFTLSAEMWKRKVPIPV